MKVAGLLKKRMLPCLQNLEMANLTGTERARYIQEMFTRIAPDYDFMNHLMTFGRDRYWRREVIKRVKLPPIGGLLLDLGGGTGDLGWEAYHSNPNTIPIEADFTLEMLHLGRQRPGSQVLHWTSADALNLPFCDEIFDAIVSGFLLRNVIDLPRTLSEQYRLLKPGAKIVALETTRPLNNPFKPLVHFYMHSIIPWLGRMISGQGSAYAYLPDSSQAFLTAEELAAYMVAAGFQNIGFERMNFGTIAIHWGVK
jgi:demethylmenaquinone methyltransferase/2-methoxy-6-polyprenyl-1,4-benzoquinol methylase